MALFGEKPGEIAWDVSQGPDNSILPLNAGIETCVRKVLFLGWTGNVWSLNRLCNFHASRRRIPFVT